MEDLRRIRVLGIGGEYEVVFSARGVAAVAFPERPLPGWARGVSLADAADPFVREVRDAFVSWAEGGGDVPRRLPLDLASGTAFQREVWGALRGIPRGRARTYGEVAEDVGRPAAARAVGQACGANPAPVVIPCHRVVSAAGLGGFGPGPEWKEALLTAEGSYVSSRRGGRA